MQWESTVFTYGGARQPPELAHYGIKGQKWGQRRFQEENGTYTAAGRERYRKSSGSSGKTGGIKKSKTRGADEKDRRQWKAKDASDLSDEELRKRNNRLQAEQNYKNNMTPQWKKDAKQFNKNAVQEAVKNIFIGTAVTALAAVMAKNYKKAGPVIAKASKVAINSIKSSIKNRKTVVDKAADRYSHNARNRKENQREYSYKPYSRNGFGVQQNWPSVNTNGNKSGKKKNDRLRG